MTAAGEAAAAQAFWTPSRGSHAGTSWLNVHPVWCRASLLSSQTLLADDGHHHQQASWCPGCLTCCQPPAADRASICLAPTSVGIGQPAAVCARHCRHQRSHSGASEDGELVVRASLADGGACSWGCCAGVAALPCCRRHADAVWSIGHRARIHNKTYSHCSWSGSDSVNIAMKSGSDTLSIRHILLSHSKMPRMLQAIS